MVEASRVKRDYARKQVAEAARQLARVTPEYRAEADRQLRQTVDAAKALGLDVPASTDARALVEWANRTMEDPQAPRAEVP